MVDVTPASYAITGGDIGLLKVPRRTREGLSKTFGVYDIEIIELVVDYLIPDNTLPNANDLTFAGGQVPGQMVDYTTGTRSFFFHSSEFGPIFGFNSLPILESVNVTPQTLFPGRGKGTSEKLSCSFTDFPHDDRGIDPWVDYRSYNPLDRSTFWRKFNARFPYITGRTIKYYQGYIDNDGWFDLENDFFVREYSIDSISGPDNSDTLKITAFDSLNQKLADKKALAPIPNVGRLSAGINNAVTTAFLDDATGYATSGVLRIDEELCDFTRSGTTLTLSRGSYNTEAASHSIDTIVQETIFWNDEPLQDVVYSLCTDYGVDLSAKITKDDWDLEKNTWMAFFNLTGHITEPTSIQKILGNMMNCMPFYLYEDVDEAAIKFVAVKPPRGTIKTINDEYNIVEDSMEIKQKPEDRVSRILYYYAPKNPFTSEDNEEEWDRIDYVDADAESDSQYGQKAIKKVFNRFFDASNKTEIETYSLRLLEGLRDIPIEITFELDEKDSLLLTEPFYLNTAKISDVFGDRVTKNLIVVQKKPIRSSGITTHTYKVEQLGFATDIKYGYIGPDTLNDYTLETDENKERYAFIADDTPELSNGDSPYLIL